MTYQRDIRIEKGRPLPPRRVRRSQWAEVFLMMEAGDRFRLKTKMDAARCSGALRAIRHKISNRLYTVRLDQDGYWYCWRLKDQGPAAASMISIVRGKRTWA